MSIDDEIKQLMKTLSKANSKQSSSITIAKLQNLTLGIHSEIDKLLEQRLEMEFSKCIPPNNKEKWRRARLWLQPVFGCVSYMNKLDIVTSYGDGMKTRSDALRKVNGARNEFAHAGGEYLADKYEAGSPQSKEAIRNLLRSLDIGLKEASKYLQDVEPILFARLVELAENERGVYEVMPPVGRFAKIYLKPPIRKISLMTSKDKATMDDFALWNGMFVEVDEQNIPTNNLVVTALSIIEGQWKIQPID